MIHHKKHNLDRARCQLKLAADMVGKLDQMRDIAADLSEN
jgi:hypothetical protein